MNRKESGFTLIELMIVVAIIAIIASIAIPNLLAARLAANESAAIATLRQLVSAEAQFQATSSADQDGDGTGEYGYFQELAGARGLRISAGANGPNLTPPVLSGAFGGGQAVGTSAEYGVTRSGYVFKIFLPNAAGTSITEGVGANPASVAADANNQEVAWCAYAFPANVGSSGNRVFFVNQTGEILQQANNGAICYGLAGANATGTAAAEIAAANSLAAFAGGTTPATTITGGTATTTGNVGQDTQTWTPVGN